MNEDYLDTLMQKLFPRTQQGMSPMPNATGLGGLAQFNKPIAPYSPQIDLGNSNQFTSGTKRPTTTLDKGTGSDFGWNMDTGKFALSGLQTLGNLFGAYQANGMARDQLDFTKSITNTNLANSIKSYNTALTDRITSRGVAQGQSSSEVNSYLDQNRLKPR